MQVCPASRERCRPQRGLQYDRLRHLASYQLNTRISPQRSRILSFASRRLGDRSRPWEKGQSKTGPHSRARLGNLGGDACCDFSWTLVRSLFGLGPASALSDPRSVHVRLTFGRHSADVRLTFGFQSCFPSCRPYVRSRSGGPPTSACFPDSDTKADPRPRVWRMERTAISRFMPRN